MQRLRITTCLLCLASFSVAAPPQVSVVIHDQANRPVQGVKVDIATAASIVSSADTDGQGRAEFNGLSPARYEITASKEGLEPIKKSLELTEGQPASLDLTAVPALARRESIDVKGTATPVDQGASAPSELPASLAKELPSRPATVSDALALLPGVVREPGGGLLISATDE